MAAHLEVERKDYGEIFDEVLSLWEKYEEEYCSLLENYYEALAERRHYKIPNKPIDPIKRSELKKFPVITLLCISDENEVIEYMLNLTEDRLILTRAQILTFFVEKPKLYEDLKAKTFDWRHQVRMKKVKKSLYAMSPEACRGGKRDSHHRLESDFNY